MSGQPVEPTADRAADYVEQHDIFRLFQRLLQELVINKPEDPLDFLIKTLQTPEAPKIIIAGAPASGKGTQCELIVKRFGVVHLSTGDILRAEVKAGTPLGQQAEGIMNAGKLVPDDLIIDIVKSKLATDECRQRGWLLDGFPRTAAQAQAMQAAGIVPDKFILLQVPDDVLIERVVGRRLDPDTGAIYHVRFNPPQDATVAARLVQRDDDTEEKARVRLQQYYNNIAAIRDSFKHITRVVNGNRSKEAVFADVEESILEKPLTRAPRRPHRVVVVGPAHDSVTALCRALASRISAVHVSAADALRAVAAGSGPDAEAARSSLEHGTLAPDDVVIRAVKNALSNPLVRTHGYVLQGFPRTAAQADAIAGLGIPPVGRAIVLDMDNAAVRERLLAHRWDPVARCFYNLLDTTPPAGVQKRLVCLAANQPEAVDQRMQAAADAAAVVKTSFPTTSRIVDGRADRRRTLELMLAFVENPLPSSM